MKKIYLISLIAGLLAGLMLVAMAAHTSSAAGRAPESSIPEVKIDNFSFAPQTVVVPLGATVKWINHDDVPHTVVSEDKVTFKSKVLDTDQEFTYTFRKSGTYVYFCSVHPTMTAKIVVQDTGSKN